MDNLLLKNLETYGDYDFKYNTDRKKTTLFGSSKIKTIQNSDGKTDDEKIDNGKMKPQIPEELE